MLTPPERTGAAYVDRFACDWHRLSATDVNPAADLIIKRTTRNDNIL